MLAVLLGVCVAEGEISFPTILPTLLDQCREGRGQSNTIVQTVSTPHQIYSSIIQKYLAMESGALP